MSREPEEFTVDLNGLIEAIRLGDRERAERIALTLFKGVRRGAMYRLGSTAGLARHMEIPVPEWYKDVLNGRVPEIVREIRREGRSEVELELHTRYAQETLDLYEALIQVHDELLEEFVIEVIVNAEKREGQKVDAFATACNKRSGWCGTCLNGRFLNHYPNFRYKAEDGFGKRNNGWRSVKRLQEKDFLRRFVSEKEINDYLFVKQKRIDYIVLRNYFLERVERDGFKVKTYERRRERRL